MGIGNRKSQKSVGSVPYRTATGSKGGDLAGAGRSGNERIKQAAHNHTGRPRGLVAADLVAGF